MKHLNENENPPPSKASREVANLGIPNSANMGAVHRGQPIDVFNYINSHFDRTQQKYLYDTDFIIIRL